MAEGRSEAWPEIGTTDNSWLISDFDGYHLLSDGRGEEMIIYS